MIASNARSYLQDAWQQPSILVLTLVLARRMQRSANGVFSMETGFPKFRGRSMAIGRKAGTPMPPRYAPIFSISSMIKRGRMATLDLASGRNGLAARVGGS